MNRNQLALPTEPVVHTPEFTCSDNTQEAYNRPWGEDLNNGNQQMLQIKVFVLLFSWRSELNIYGHRSEMTAAPQRSSLCLGRLFPGALGAPLLSEGRGEAAQGEICQLGGYLWTEHPDLQQPEYLSSLASRKEKLSITKISWTRQPQVSSPILT